MQLYSMYSCTRIKAANLLMSLAEQTELEVNVVKLPAKAATGSLHNNCAALEGHLDCKKKSRDYMKMPCFIGKLKTFELYMYLNG